MARCGTYSSLEALRVDCERLRWKEVYTVLTVSSHVLGLLVLCKSSTLPVSLNFLYQLLMLFTSGGLRPYSLLKFLCTVIGEFVSWYHKTHWAFSTKDAISYYHSLKTVCVKRTGRDRSRKFNWAKGAVRRQASLNADRAFVQALRHCARNCD